MYLLFQFYTSGREQRVERDDTVFVVFCPLYSDTALIRVKIPYPGQPEF